MNLDRFFRVYLERYEAGTARTICEEGYILTGCIQLYKVTGNMFYKDFVKMYMKDLIDDLGMIKGYHKESFSTDNIFIGNVLLWLFEETGENKYKLAAEMLRKQLHEHPRTSCGNFIHSLQDPDVFCMDDLYFVEPFYMEYETKFESKECYLDIVAQFESAKKYLYNSDLKSCGRYMMALIDTMDVMSPEIFEHYKTLEKIFKELVNKVLECQDRSTGLFTESMKSGTVLRNSLDETSSIMIGYAIMKACNLGVLLKEKYFELGRSILEVFLERRLLKKEQDNLCSSTKEDDICQEHEETGILMMAYSQYKMQNATKKN